MKYLKQFIITFIALFVLFYTANGQTVINLASQCNCEVLSGTAAPAPGAPIADAGNLYVNTTTGEIYTYDGTAWTVVSEDTPDIDWYKVGGTTPPTAITDDITTNGDVGIGVATPAQQLHVAGSIRTDARNIYFGPTQRFSGNNGANMYLNSNNASVTKLLLRDSDNVLYGGLVGTTDGLNLGLNDKDSHWTFRSVHDQFLTMSIDNSEKVRILLNGNVGIGTTGPTAKLDVNGTTRLRTLAAGAATEMELVVDGNGVVKKRMAGDNSSTNELPVAGNDIDVMGNTVNIEPTLDFVHTVNSPAQNFTASAGGNIFMRAWFDGHVGVGNLAGSLSPQAGLHVAHNDGTIMDGNFGAGLYNAAGGGTRLVWSSKNASLRAGRVNGTQWDEANIGDYSTGFGFNSLASGTYSIAAGRNSEASGIYSLAIGNTAVATNTNTIALGQGTVSTGNSTIAIGFNCQAVGTGSKSFGGQTHSSGFNSLATGDNTFARSRGEMVVGMFSTDYTPTSANTWNGNDRIFNVGVGKDSLNRKDALTMFKRGLSRFNGYAEIITDNTADEALNINNSGTGVGQVLTMQNATSTAMGLNLRHDGLGIGQQIFINNVASNGVALKLFHNGIATAQDIIMNNATSTANGLYLRHNGLGNGQQIVMSNSANDARGIDIVNQGRGDGIFINSPSAFGHAAVFNSGSVVANEIGGNYDFRIESDTRTHAFWMDANEDIANFGSPLSFATGNGTTVGTTTVQYVADFDIGVNEGTAIGIGSVEFLLDNIAETTINNSFSPSTHIVNDLGNSTTVRAWDDVYADDFINVSDLREKENVQDITYGLSELMNMRAVSYKLTRDPFKESKLGLIAQDVLPLVSEAVKTHDYKILDEQKGEFESVELERMGIKYQQLTPVVIKAIQEQQEQISTLTESNEDLMKENQELNSEIDAINEKLDKIMLMLDRD